MLGKIEGRKRRGRQRMAVWWHHRLNAAVHGLQRVRRDWTTELNWTEYKGFITVNLVAQLVKNPTAMQKTPFRSLGWQDPLQKRMATHSSILAWRIPWTEDPGGLQSLGSQRIRHDWATKQKQPEESQSTVFTTYLGCFFLNLLNAGEQPELYWFALLYTCSFENKLYYT